MKIVTPFTVGDAAALVDRALEKRCGDFKTQVYYAAVAGYLRGIIIAILAEKATPEMLAMFLEEVAQGKHSS